MALMRSLRGRLAAVAPLVILLAAAIGLGARPAGAQSCVGDCTGKGSVAITDLILGVNIALGLVPVSQCESLDANTDGMVSISELITAVNNALTGQCVVPTPIGTATPSLPSTTATPNPSTGTTTATPPSTATPTATSVPRFVDHGDGTITDLQTGLMWEKKVGLGSGADAAKLHDADNSYSWAGECSQMTSMLCQPDAAASACSNGAEGDHSGCATCQGQGTCAPHSPGALTTIWDWLTQLNTAGFAGHNDWRLPTEAELASIVDFATTSPAVDVAFNGTRCGPGCTDLANPACSCTPKSSFYWSASAYKVGAAWGVFSSSTTSSSTVQDSANASVRAVRDGSPPMPRYVDNGDGTVTDQLTQLTWEKKVALDLVADPANLHDAFDKYALAGTCTGNATKSCQPTADASAACIADADGDASSCAQCAEADGSCNVTDTVWTWVAALNAASFAGHTDWRMPTIHELQSLVAYADSAPAVTAAFHGSSCGMTCTDVTNPACSCTKADTYWSASTFVLDPTAAWIVNFDFGYVTAPPRATTGSSRVRAVRGGT